MWAQSEIEQLKSEVEELVIMSNEIKKEFDLEKAMENGGKCVVNLIGERSDGIIVYDKYGIGLKELLVVVHTPRNGDSIISYFCKTGDGFNSSIHLENVPESREVFIAITNRGIIPFNLYEELVEYCETMSKSSINIFSTGKMTLTDGEFFDSENDR